MSERKSSPEILQWHKSPTLTIMNQPSRIYPATKTDKNLRGSKETRDLSTKFAVNA